MLDKFWKDINEVLLHNAKLNVHKQFGKPTNPFPIIEEVKTDTGILTKKLLID